MLNLLGGAFIFLVLVAIIAIVSALQFWPNNSRNNKLIAFENELSDPTCGIAAPDDVQNGKKNDTQRTQLKQDEFAAVANDCKKNGIYLEIGGHHPVNLSNTYLLEKRLGWSGFSVDPFPTADFSIRKKCKFDKIALASSNKPAEFDTYAIAEYGGFKGKEGDAPKVGDSHAGKKTVVTITPETPRDYFKRVNMPKVVDYLSIDVEGAEVDVLGAIDWNNFCARVITAEHNNIEKIKNGIHKILTEKSKCTLVRHEKFDGFYKCAC